MRKTAILVLMIIITSILTTGIVAPVNLADAAILEIESKYIWVSTYDASTNHYFYIDQGVMTENGAVTYSFVKFRVYEVVGNVFEDWVLLYEEEDTSPSLKRLSWSIEGDESSYSGKCYDKNIRVKVIFDSEISSGSSGEIYWERRFGFAKVTYAWWPKELLPEEGLSADAWWGSVYHTVQTLIVP